MEDALPWTTRLLTPGKPVLPWIAVSILAISTRSNHDYTLGAHFMMFLQSVYHLITSSSWFKQETRNMASPTWGRLASQSDWKYNLWGCRLLADTDTILSFILDIRDAMYMTLCVYIEYGQHLYMLSCTNCSPYSMKTESCTHTGNCHVRLGRHHTGLTNTSTHDIWQPTTVKIWLNKPNLLVNLIC